MNDALRSDLRAAAAMPLIPSCDGCSGCCRSRSVPPFAGLNDPEYLALPDGLREPLAPMLTAPPPDYDHTAACCWLDTATHRCRNYEHRPAACREFERGSFYCHVFRRKWQFPEIPQSE